MNNKSEDIVQKQTGTFLYAGVGAVLFAGLFIVSRFNYVLFHGLAELFSIAVAWSVFLLIWNARRIARNDALVFLGSAYFFIGMIDLIHTLGYKGTGFFENDLAANYATQLWISARGMETFSLLLYPLLTRRRIQIKLVFAGYICATAILFLAIFSWGIFPECYIDGVGLTAFKKLSEYAICLILVGAITLLTRRREWVDPDVYRLMVWAMAVTIVAELFFTFYVSVYGLSNVAGHFFKIISYFLVYLALIRSTFTHPYTTIFQELEQEKQSLRESEAFKGAVISCSPIPIVSLDTDGNVMSWNPAAERVFGWTADETIGRPMPIVSTEKQEEFADLRKRIIVEGGFLGKEIVCQKKDGGLIDISLSSALIHDDSGNLIGIIAAMEDITEQKRVVDALWESEKRFRTAGKAAYDLIYEWDVAGDILEWFGGIDELLGYRKGEISRDIKAWLDLIHPEDKVKLENAVEIHRTSTNPIQYEYRVRHKDGTYRHWNDHALPLLDDKGCPYKWVGICTDITERKRADEALAKSEALLREAQGAAHIGHWELDTSIMIPAWSEEIFHIFGLDPEEDEPSFEAHQKVTHPDDWGILNNAVTTSIVEGIPFDIEFRILRPDKTIRWMHAIGHSKKDSEGRIISVFGTVQDITDRKLIKNALRVSLEKYRVLFESFPLGITISDKAGKIIEANLKSERMLGVTHEAHAQRRIDSKEWQIIRKDGTPMPADEYASTRALRENRLIENVEMGIVKDKGEITWISVTSAPIPLEGYGVAIAFSDITERLSAEQASKQTEEALRLSEENFHCSLDDSPLGVRIVTAEGETIYANRAILDIYGYDSVEELRTTPIKNRYTPQSYAEFKIRREKRKWGNGPSEYEISIVRKNGEVRHLQVFRKEMLWNGEMQFQIVYQDITERKRMEKDIINTVQQLHETRDMLIQFEKEAVVGRLVIGFAHEVLNPVSIISSRLQFMEDETLTDEAMESVKICREQLQRITKISQDLHQSASKQPGMLIGGDLRRVIEEGLQMMERRIKEAHVQVEYDPPSEVIPVKMERDKLVKVMVNLILNACDAMSDKQPKRLIITVHRPEDSSEDYSIFLTVADNGQGIPTGNMDLIFEPFFTTKDPGKGTGLGLSVCKGIIQEHGGTIHVEKNDLGGVSFVVELPLDHP